MQNGISFAQFIANDNGYGYDQPTRQTGWEKYQSDPSCTSQCGSFDCSSFISAALTEAGYFTTNPNFITGNEASELEGVGFKQVATSAHTSANLQPGDILLAAGHTEMYIGNNQNVGAHSNENGGISGGTVGDKNGTEISVTPFYDGSWIGVYRAPN
jgi:cell wall-associated NlpC family hydrolase